MQTMEFSWGSDQQLQYPRQVSALLDDQVKLWQLEIDHWEGGGHRIH
jgi:hypothetical protein